MSEHDDIIAKLSAMAESIEMDGVFYEVTVEESYRETCRTLLTGFRAFVRSKEMDQDYVMDRTVDLLTETIMTIHRAHWEDKAELARKFQKVIADLM